MLRPAALFVLAVFAPAAAAHPPTVTIPWFRFDDHGHRLPPGAVARLGDYAQRYSPTTHLAFSADGRQLARVRGQKVEIRDTITGRDITPPYLRGPTTVTRFHFTPDGRHIVCGPEATTVQVRDPVTGVVAFDLSQQGRSPWAVSVGRNGLAALVHWSSGGSYGLTFFELAPGKQPVARDIFTRNYGTFYLTPDNALAVGVAADDARGYDTVTAAVMGQHRMGKNAGIHGSALSRDGTVLAASYTDGLRLYPVTAGGLGEPTLVNAGRNLRVLVFTDDGQELVGLAGDGSLVRLSLPDGKLVATVPIDAQANEANFALSADGRFAAAAIPEKPTRVWDTQTGREQIAFPELMPVQRLQLVGRDRVAVCDSAVVRVYRVPTGELLSERPIPGDEPGRKVVAISPDGNRVALTLPTRGNNPIAVRDLETGRELWAADTASSWMDAAFSPDGTRLVVNGREMYDAATGRHLHQFLPLKGYMETTAFSPDGRLVATGWGKPATVTELATLRVRFPFENPGGDGMTIRHLRFSRDGRFLAAFGSNRTLVWSLAEGNQAYDESRGAAMLEPGDISPDGRWLVQATAGDRGVRVRDWAAPRNTTRDLYLAGDQATIRDVAFTPDGKHVLTAGADGTVLIWDTSWFAASAVIHPREWTTAELWDALDDVDATAAGRAIVELARRPTQAVELFRKRLPPAAAPAAAEVAALVARLDHDQYAEREAAEAALVPIAEFAEDALRDAARNSPSTEVRTRAGRILGRLDGPVRDPARMRAVRAVEVAERIDTPEAKALLADWAAGDGRALLTREAKTALARLADKP